MINQLSNGGTVPVLSLVMPVYNEGGNLGVILDRLGDVDFPVPWELIIVNDGSTDGAVDEIRREWEARNSRVPKTT